MSDAPVRPVLQARGLVKRYGQVTALDGADFELLPGEILAVIGDNGAGKSMLIKALSGALIPDEGEIRLDGKPVKLHSPVDARRHGIETVYQDLAVAPSMSIAENLFLGREIRRSGLLGFLVGMLDKKRMLEEAVKHLRDLQINILKAETDLMNAPETGSPLFTMNAEIAVPPSITFDMLCKDLAAIATELAVDIDLLSSSTWQAELVTV